MKYLKPLLLCLCSCSGFIAHSHHPEDDLIILEIEEGELNMQDEQMTYEYQAALKRQRMRRLAALTWQERFLIFTRAGIEHIVPKGLDHILFVLGLFFSSLILGSLLWQVTAFTLAHTSTLALAAVGIVQIPGTIVEPIIALSIVWIAVENCIFKQTSRWRPLVVFCFGLLHGLGFASVLNDYGLPKGNFISSLLAFNVGVELGQLLVLATAAALVWLVREKKWYRHRIQIPASLMIALVGVYWFLERTLF